MKMNLYYGGHLIQEWCYSQRTSRFKKHESHFEKNNFKITFNTAFEDVIQHCAQIKRDGQDDTWITNDMTEAYIKLHKQGIATSVEVWQNEELVGGLIWYRFKRQKSILWGKYVFKSK